MSGDDTKGGESSGDAESRNQNESPGKTNIEHRSISDAWLGGWDMTMTDLTKMGSRSGERQAIIVGRVISADVSYDTSIIAHDSADAETPPADNPKSKSQATPDAGDSSTGVPFTHSKVRIESIIDAPGMTAGDTIDVSQMGELKAGIAYEVSGDPLILVGQVFLLFVTEPRKGTWVSHPAGRFEVDEKGQLQAVSPEWEKTPAATELRGLTLENAAAVIDRAIKEGASAPTSGP